MEFIPPWLANGPWDLVVKQISKVDIQSRAGLFRVSDMVHLGRMSCLITAIRAVVINIENASDLFTLIS